MESKNGEIYNNCLDLFEFFSNSLFTNIKLKIYCFVIFIMFDWKSHFPIKKAARHEGDCSRIIH